MFVNTTPEREALGSAIVDERAADKVCVLDAADFEHEADKEIINAIKGLRSQGEAVTLVTVADAISPQYAEYLVDVAAGAITTVNIDKYIGMVQDKARRRRLRSAATALFNAASDTSLTLDEITAEFAGKVDSISGMQGRTVSSWDAVLAFIEELERKDTDKALTGIPLLDQALGGMQGGRLYVVGARPATGKTALAISAAMNTSAYGDVLFCSYEMRPNEIIGRVLSRLSRVDSQDIAYKTLSAEQMQKLGQYYAKAGKLPIRFGEDCEKVERVRAEALRMKNGGNLRLIVIDYLQLMSSGQRAEDRRVEVGQISRALKKLSIELNVPILALSQLNRASEGRASKAPTMSEMRESGDIEQDADAIVLMYQLPDECNTFVATCEDVGYKAVRILLDKNRQGKSGVAIDTAFDGSTMTFISKSAVMEVGK